MAWFLKNKDITIIKKLLHKAKPYDNYDEAFADIKPNANRRFVISFLNMFAIQTALKNEEFLEALMRSDILLLDGIGAKLLCKKFDIPHGINMNGTDFIPWLLNEFKAKSFLAFGSNNTTIDKFREKLSDYNILHTEDGFKSYKEYIDAAKKYPYEVMLLGMGMPKQELLASKIKLPGIIINGGAIIDYMSGVKMRAPKLFIMLEIEWVYRMFYEPGRLFKRYMDGIILISQIALN